MPKARVTTACLYIRIHSGFWCWLIFVSKLVIHCCPFYKAQPHKMCHLILTSIFTVLGYSGHYLLTLFVLRFFVLYFRFFGPFLYSLLFFLRWVFLCYLYFVGGIFTSLFLLFGGIFWHLLSSQIWLFWLFWLI